MKTRIALAASAWIAAWCIGGASAAPDNSAPERRATTSRNLDGSISMSERDARGAVEAMRSRNVSLTKAIDTAESRADGKAISATCYAGNDPVVKVCCVDKQNQIKVVLIDLDGKVIGVHDARFTTASGAMSNSHDSSMSAGVVRADEITGRQVKNPNGESLGKIDDLVIDTQRGRVAYAVLATGGVLGVNEKLFALPWSSLHSLRSDTLLLDVDKAQLERAPSFDKQHWPDWSNNEWARSIHGYYHQQPYWELDGKGVATPPSFLIKASDILGKKVINTSDEDLGKVEDLALDPDSGRIAYAALSFGGFLGINDKLFAIPWTALMRSNEGKWILSIPKDRLKASSGFDQKSWPSSANPEFARIAEPEHSNR